MSKLPSHLNKRLPRLPNSGSGVNHGDMGSIPDWGRSTRHRTVNPTCCGVNNVCVTTIDLVL